MTAFVSNSIYFAYRTNIAQKQIARNGQEGSLGLDIKQIKICSNETKAVDAESPWKRAFVVDTCFTDIVILNGVFKIRL